MASEAIRERMIKRPCWRAVVDLRCKTELWPSFAQICSIQWGCTSIDGHVRDRLHDDTPDTDTRKSACEFQVGELSWLLPSAENSFRLLEWILGDGKMMSEDWTGDPKRRRPFIYLFILLKNVKAEGRRRCIWTDASRQREIKPNGTGVGNGILRDRQLVLLSYHWLIG